MKIYEIEMRYTAYTTVTIEASSQEEAEAIAWQELETDGSHRSDYGNWQLESIEEITT